MGNRYTWLDYIRAIAALLVVLLHTAAPYLYEMENISLSTWNVGNYVDSFTRISVPLFFMISGFIFFREKSPRLKHFIRIFSALLFYSVISLIYIKFYRGSSISGLTKDILIKPVFYHLWFFYAIVLLYVMAMFITIRNVTYAHALGLFAILFIALNPRLKDITIFYGFSFSSYLQIEGNIIYYFLYAIFGAMLGITDKIKNPLLINCAPLAVYIVTSLCIGYGTYVASVSANKFCSPLYNNNGILVALGAVSIFLYIKDNHEKLSILNTPLTIISKNSLAIYGVHALILDAIYSSGYRDYSNPLVDIPLVFSVALMSSLIIGIIIKRFDKKNLVT